MATTNSSQNIVVKINLILILAPTLAPYEEVLLLNTYLKAREAKVI